MNSYSLPISNTSAGVLAFVQDKSESGARQSKPFTSTNAPKAANLTTLPVTTSPELIDAKNASSLASLAASLSAFSASRITLCEPTICFLLPFDSTFSAFKRSCLPTYFSRSLTKPILICEEGMNTSYEPSLATRPPLLEPVTVTVKTSPSLIFATTSSSSF